MTEEQFAAVFNELTGSSPFPWQWNLYDRWFSKGRFPCSCNIPTGLGKTSIIAVWLIALAKHRDTIPRRLVYVVNRRTVVDQTTDEVKKLRGNLLKAGLFDALKSLCALPLEEDESPLALSTLRGAFADNREWSADPARPAVISGTVDMIGSRLLFGGYGIGFKSRPLHAGLLGQDVLLVHDEAHLEPAFQDLITAIECEQKRCNDPLKQICSDNPSNQFFASGWFMCESKVSASHKLTSGRNIFFVENLGDPLPGQVDCAGLTGFHSRHIDPPLLRPRPRFNRRVIPNSHLGALRQRRRAFQHHHTVLHSTWNLHVPILPTSAREASPARPTTAFRDARRQHPLQWGRDFSAAERLSCVSYSHPKANFNGAALYCGYCLLWLSDESR